MWLLETLAPRRLSRSLGSRRAGGRVQTGYGVEPIAHRDPVLLAPIKEPSVIFVMIAIVAVVSTLLVFLLRETAPEL